MEHTIDPKMIYVQSLKQVFSSVEAIMKKGGGTLQITELLTILNFPQDVNLRIRTKRQALKVKCSGTSCTATNTGKKVKENLPGTSALGIIIHEKFSCKFNLNEKTKTLIIDDIKGLDADIPGPFNPDIDKITIKLPNHVSLEV